MQRAGYVRASGLSGVLPGRPEWARSAARREEYSRGGRRHERFELEAEGCGFPSPDRCLFRFFPPLPFLSLQRLDFLSNPFASWVVWRFSCMMRLEHERTVDWLRFSAPAAIDRGLVRRVEVMGGDRSGPSEEQFSNQSKRISYRTRKILRDCFVGIL